MTPASRLRRSFSLLVFSCAAFSLATGAEPSAASSTPATTGESHAIFNVRNFGATGEGKAKDTAALQKALDACAEAGGGTVLVPAGYYLTGSLHLKSKTTLSLEGKAFLIGSPDIADYPLARVRWEGEFQQGHRALLWAENANDISIIGPGVIFGPPIPVACLRDPRAPSLIEFSECTNVVLDSFTTQYERVWSIHPVLCQNFTARNLIIRSVFTNGDGIDVDSCRDVLIERCNIDTGDDAIALKSGRGMEGVRTARPTENVVIRDCVLTGSMYGAIGIGTELSGGIRNVRIENCVLSGKGNAIIFKSRDGRGGFIENVTGENLVVHNSGNFICIDLLKRGIQATEPVPGATEQWTQVSNIRFSGVRVFNVTQLVNAGKVPPERPLQGFTLSDVTGDCEKGITLANMTDVTLSQINVTGYQGGLLSTENVSGAGLVNPEKPAK
ncbi:MAG: glycoside hydrolase family 28 protein [Nibricoccus sp.]